MLLELSTSEKGSTHKREAFFVNKEGHTKMDKKKEVSLHRVLYFIKLSYMLLFSEILLE